MDRINGYLTEAEYRTHLEPFLRAIGSAKVTSKRKPATVLTMTCQHCGRITTLGHHGACRERVSFEERLARLSVRVTRSFSAFDDAINAINNAFAAAGTMNTRRRTGITPEQPPVTLACGHTRNPDEFVTDNACDDCNRQKLRNAWQSCPQAFKVEHNLGLPMPFGELSYRQVIVTDWMLQSLGTVTSLVRPRGTPLLAYIKLEGTNGARYWGCLRLEHGDGYVNRERRNTSRRQAKVDRRTV